MTVYIEYAILDNFIVDYFLLKESAFLLRKRVKRPRLILASIFGTAVAVILPLFDLGYLWEFLIKVFSGLIICCIAARHENLLSFVKFFNVFLLLTFFLGGVVIGVVSILGIPYDFEAYYSNKLLPIGLNVLFGYLLVKGVKRFIEKNLSAAAIAADTYEIEVVIRGKSYTGVAFFDSGNRLTDERDGLPVVVCSKKFFKRLYSGGALIPRGAINYSTATGVARSSLYYIDYAVVYDSKKGKATAAYVMQGNVNSNIADALIGKDFF